MWHISEKEFDSRMKKIQDKNKSKERKEKLKAEKNKFKQKPKTETSKLLAIYLFFIFNVILVYSMVAMWVFEDISYLSVLITDIIGQILLFGIYCLKAYNGKKQEEKIKFEREKLLNTISTDDINDIGADIDLSDYGIAG